MAKIIYQEDRRVPKLQLDSSNVNKPHFHIEVMLQRVKVADWAGGPTQRYLQTVSCLLFDYKDDEDPKSIAFREEFIDVPRTRAIRAAIAEFDRQVKDAEDWLAMDREVGKVKEADNGI